MSEARVTITLSCPAKFAEKLIGFLHNLNAVNDSPAVVIEDVEVDEDPDIVAVPKKP